MHLNCLNCKSSNYYITASSKATCRSCGNVFEFTYNMVPGMPELKAKLMQALEYDTTRLNELAAKFFWHSDKTPDAKHAIFFNMAKYLEYGESFKPNQVPVLTLQQPYASLMAAGKKQIDTRQDKCSYRGYVLIHAASTLPADLPALMASEPYKTDLVAIGITTPEEPYKTDLAAIGITTPEELPTGAIVGVAWLHNCLPVVSPVLTSYKEEVAAGKLFYGLTEGTEAAYSDFTPKRHVYLYQGFKQLEEPVKCPEAVNGFSPYMGSFKDLKIKW